MDRSASKLHAIEEVVSPSRTKSDASEQMANPQDVEAPIDESTPLVPMGTMIGTDADEAIDLNMWDELSQPWPSTFERSISLLASPMVSPKQVEIFTQSPKPGASYLGLAKRRERMNESPIPQSKLLPPTKGRRVLATRQSLDSAFTSSYRSGRESLQATTQATLEQEKRKAQEAKAYRQHLLNDRQQGYVSPDPTKPQTSHMAEIETEGKATFSQCVFNMANILMGVGLLGLPFVFMSAGWLGGSLVLLVFGFITWKTSILIGRELNGDPRKSHVFSDSPYLSPLVPGSVPEARVRRPLRSFPDIAREAFGDLGCLVLSVVLYFELFSCLCIFLVTLGDHLHELAPWISTRNHTIIVGALSTIPTIVLRTPRLLSYLSMIGFISTIFVVATVVMDSFAEGDLTEQAAKARGIFEETEPSKRFFGGPQQTFLALGMVAYCFSGHAIVPSIYSSMERPQDFDRMITTSYLVVVGCSFLVAVSGYYMFGYAVEDQITLSLAQESSNTKLMHILTWLMTLTVFSKLSLNMFPLALGMEELVSPYVSSEQGMFAASCIIKVIITFLALTVAILLPSFSFLCAFVGVIFTVAVSVVFPAAAHLKLFNSRLTWSERCLDWFLVIFGCIAATVGTFATLLNSAVE